MNAFAPPPRPARQTRAPRRDRDAAPAADGRLVAVAAEDWPGLPVPLALERLLDRLEAPEPEDRPRR